jgi:hypothetical protein
VAKSRRVGPTERMLSVLARLRSDPERVWPVERVKRDISGYENGVSCDRNWLYDSAALQARGLIKTGLTRPHTPRRTGVRYGLPVKPGNLHLSVREHAALVQARRARGTTEMPNPVAGDTSRAKSFEVTADSLRRLEDQGEWTTVGALAREMGQPRPARLLDKLKMAWCLDVDGRSVFDQVLLIEYCDGDRDVPPAEVRICVVRRTAPNEPLRETGLALVGIGAYTLEETAERLDLIADVLAGKLPGDAAVLESARSKLLRWQQMLRVNRR